MIDKTFELDVLVNGRPVKVYYHTLEGKIRAFIEARENSAYSIRVRNNSYRKVLGVVAVDSLNVVTGDVSDGYKGRGYIIQPYRSVDIKGFRVSDKEVGQFVFTSKGQSYAAEQGLAQNTGIISCNIIAEKEEPKPKYIDLGDIQPVPYYPPIVKPWLPKTYDDHWVEQEQYRSSCSNLGSGNNIQAAYFSASAGPVGELGPAGETGNKGPRSKGLKLGFDMGTTFGDKLDDSIVRKGFKKGPILATFDVYYASLESLKSMGVPVVDEKSVNLPPSFKEQEYCKPPKHWRK